MNGNYRVFFGNQPVGTVQFDRQGLYYAVFCRCQLSGEIICRLQISCNGKKENLGILVPKDSEFVLNTKVPVKKIGEGELSFLLVPKHEISSGTFCPICPEEPFAYISKLRKSFLERRNGVNGIIV